MLLYDHDRTERIVERLRNAEGVVRFITVVSSMTFFALVGMSAGATARSSEGVIIGGVIGAGVGLGIGNLSMVLVSAIIEWMCQLLIAQGELVKSPSASRKSSCPRQPIY
jgi:hypothetical protein